MITRLNIYLSLALVLACLFSKPVLAHKLNAAESTIEYNPRTELIEIVHRFYLHDVNHLTQALAKTDKGINSQEAKYQVFTKYILDNLEIQFGLASSLNVNFVGSEKESKYFYIYQEYRGESLTEALSSISISINTMKNSWKPKYWLFQIDVSAKLKQSFVLDNQLLSYTVKS